MKKIILILLVLSTAACSQAEKQKALFNSERAKFYKDYSEDRIAAHRSILVVPPINNTVNVAASGYFLSGITLPLAERGYYIFPVNLVKKVMEEEGMSDAHLVHHANPQTLSEMFGADAILYTTINKWEAKYIALSTVITVDLTYVLKSGQDGSILWKATQAVVYDSNQDVGNSGGGLTGLLISMTINALATKAMEEGKYFLLVRQSNIIATHASAHHLPSGPYLVEYEKAQKIEAEEKAKKKAEKKKQKK